VNGEGLSPSCRFLSSSVSSLPDASFMSISSRNRFILHATCGYLLFGSAWIFLFDRLLLSFTDMEALTR
jgi:hypothetical protein